MATNYGYYQRKRGVYKKGDTKPFKLSRSKIDLFYECPRCFYLDRRHGLPRPSFPAFTLNSAVDGLLKKEFDSYREKQEAHPLMKEFGIDAIPFAHGKMEDWRHNFTGVQHHHEPTNFLVFGAVDDIWMTPADELIVVDYKATAKDEKPNIEGFWQQAYKRQMEVYQWLLRGNGFDVSNTGYFVYVNGRKGEDAFEGKLLFDTDVIAYTGNGDWIDDTLKQAKECLESDKIPGSGENCEYCPYRDMTGKTLREQYLKDKKEPQKAVKKISSRKVQKQESKDTLF